MLATLRVAHNFLRFTNEETSFFTVHRRRCGASGTRRCYAPARVFGAQPPKTTGAGKRSTRVRYLPAPALTGSNPSAYSFRGPAKAEPLKLVELAGLEPATLCLQSRCATSCAIAPLEQETPYRYFHTPGSLRRSFAAFTSQAKNTPINNSFKVFFKSTYLADCWNKLPLQWA